MGGYRIFPREGDRYIKVVRARAREISRGSGGILPQEILKYGLSEMAFSAFTLTSGSQE